MSVGVGSPIVTVSLWRGGGMTHRGFPLHPCKHFYKHVDASCETRTETHKLKLRLVTRGWAGLTEGMGWSEKS